MKIKTVRYFLHPPTSRPKATSAIVLMGRAQTVLETLRPSDQARSTVPACKGRLYRRLVAVDIGRHSHADGRRSFYAVVLELVRQERGDNKCLLYS